MSFLSRFPIPAPMNISRFLYPLAGGFAGLLLIGCQSTAPKTVPLSPITQQVDAQSKLSPQQIADVQVALGRSLEKRGEVAQATAAYLEAVKQDSTRADAYLRLAAIHDQQHKFGDAMAYYRKALAVQPDNADAYCNLGYSFYLRSRWDDAEKNLRRAIVLEPGHERAHNNLGFVLAHTGRVEEALAEFRKGGCTEADAHINVAFSLTLERAFLEARRHYEKALELQPKSERARKGLGELDCICARLGGVQETRIK